MRVKAVIFDVDGTLVDSNDIHARCWVEAFAHFGREIPFRVMREQIGKGGDLLVPDLLQARDIQRFGEELKKFRAHLFKDRYMKQVQPFAYATASIRRLNELGIQIALASSADEEEVEYYTQLLGIEEFLDASTSKNDARFSKPSPEIFQAALERTSATPREALVVGDTPYDVLAAHRAALPIAAVLSGGFTRSSLEKAEFLFQDVKEVVEELETVDEYFAT